jgi:hypothetical protein
VVLYITLLLTRLYTTLLLVMYVVLCCVVVVQGLLYKSGGYYKDSLQKFANKGITTAAILCNFYALSNTCSSYDYETVALDFADNGVDLKYILQLDSGSATYASDLQDAVQQLIADDVDLVVAHDFQVMCVDFVAAARRELWTPRALYLNLCGQDSDTLAQLGTDVRDSDSGSERVRVIVIVREEMAAADRTCNTRLTLSLTLSLSLSSLVCCL